jgi:hypothetical protein
MLQAAVTNKQFAWTDRNGNKAHCRLDILRGANDHPIVILTELADNPGLSVTNAAAFLTGAVRSQFKLPESAIYIEHYGPMSYSLRFDDDIYSRIITAWDAADRNVAQDWQYLSHEDMWMLLPETEDGYPAFPFHLEEEEYPFRLTQGKQP